MDKLEKLNQAKQQLEIAILREKLKRAKDVIKNAQCMQSELEDRCKRYRNNSTMYFNAMTELQDRNSYLQTHINSMEQEQLKYLKLVPLSTLIPNGIDSQAFLKACDDGQHIMAIKMLRQYGVNGLKVAKELYEQVYRRLDRYPMPTPKAA